MIWTDTFLNQLADDAERRIVADVPCLFYRFCLATTAGTSVYTMPSDIVKGIKRITWRGRKVEPLSWEQFVLLTPATVVVNENNKFETTNSRPQWYTIHPTNIHDIRFFPTPDESFSGAGDPMSPDVGPTCIISAWRFVDTSTAQSSLPTYIDRRTRKAYILWKAFEAEGPGQNMNGAMFYKNLYFFLIENFKLINDGSFVSKKYSLGDGLFGLENYRYPKPLLPPNFERIIY